MAFEKSLSSFKFWLLFCKSSPLKFKFTAVFSAKLALSRIRCFSGKPEKFNEASSILLSLTLRESAVNLASQFLPKSKDHSIFLPSKFSTASCSTLPLLTISQFAFCFFICQSALMLATCSMLFKSNDRPSILPLSHKLLAVGLSTLNSPCTFAVNSANLMLLL